MTRDSTKTAHTSPPPQYSNQNYALEHNNELMINYIYLNNYILFSH